jgi:hypothetical protein
MNYKQIEEEFSNLDKERIVEIYNPTNLKDIKFYLKYIYYVNDIENKSLEEIIELFVKNNQDDNIYFKNDEDYSIIYVSRNVTNFNEHTFHLYINYLKENYGITQSKLDQAHYQWGEDIKIYFNKEEQEKLDLFLIKIMLENI